MGAGLGSALVGMRPIIEMRIFDFVMCAMDELVNQIAKIRYMFGGQAKPAVVVRMPHGMWRNSAAQHSQMLEAWFAHLPGVMVVTPSTAGGHRGAAGAGDPLATIRCCSSIRRICSGAPGEHRRSDRADPVRRRAQSRPKATPRRSCPGRRRCRSPPRASRCWRAEGIKVDLLDLRTIWPWDQDAVIASVKKTGRLLVVHEAVEVAGFGAEIVARVVDRRRAFRAQGRQAPRRAAHSDPVRAAAGGRGARHAREGGRGGEGDDRVAVMSGLVPGITSSDRQKQDVTGRASGGTPVFDGLCPAMTITGPCPSI